MKNYDLVIVGTGVVGLGAAIAAKKLKPKIKILLIDRHQQCTSEFDRTSNQNLILYPFLKI